MHVCLCKRCVCVSAFRKAQWAQTTYPSILHNIVKQLTATDVLHDHVDVCGRANHLVTAQSTGVYDRERERRALSDAQTARRAYCDAQHEEDA
jgi:hypothetical protein